MKKCLIEKEHEMGLTLLIATTSQLIQYTLGTLYAAVAKKVWDKRCQEQEPNRSHQPRQAAVDASERLKEYLANWDSTSYSFEDEDSDSTADSDTDPISNLESEVRRTTSTVYTAWVLNPLPDPLVLQDGTPPLEIQLESLNPEGVLPRRHLIRRMQMLFYSYGRLRKLCDKIGKRLKDICIFGKRRYVDYRPYKIKKPKGIHAAHIFSLTKMEFELIERKLKELGATDKEIQSIKNIFSNMMGQTEFVNSNFNTSGTVGRVLDNVTEEILSGNFGTITLANVHSVVQLIVSRMRSSITVESKVEINAAISQIESFPLDYWVNLYNSGYKGTWDDTYNVPNKYIADAIEEYFDRWNDRKYC